MTQIELENTKLQQVAAEYQQKGYDVSMRPDSSDVPEFLAPFQADLIATSATDNVVVEVKPSRDLTEGSLAPLAARIESALGWRLELVLVNQASAPEVPAFGVLVPEDRVDNLLHEAQL